MRICRLAWSFPKAGHMTHGLGPNFYYISTEQARLGLDVQVISLARDNSSSFETVDGVKVHRVRPPYNVNGMRALLRLHKHAPVDIVHAHGTCGLAYPLVRSLIKRPLVVHVHGTTLESRRRTSLQGSYSSSRAKGPPRESLALLRQRFFWRRANLLIAVSQAARQELINLYHIPEDKIRVVYNGIDPETFHPIPDTSHLRKQLNIPDEKQIILYVGHFGPRKGLPILLDAMKQVLQEIPDAFVLAVGGTPKWLGRSIRIETIQDQVRSRQLNDSIKILGEVPHQTLPEYYSLADLFVLPSYYEALGKVILEAMACETPVIATRTGGIPEIVKDETNGLLVEPGNPHQLAEQIISLLQDPSKARRMAMEARKMVQSELTWEQTAKKILEAYQAVL